MVNKWFGKWWKRKSVVFGQLAGWFGRLSEHPIQTQKQSELILFNRWLFYSLIVRLFRYFAIAWHGTIIISITCCVMHWAFLLCELNFSSLCQTFGGTILIYMWQNWFWQVEEQKNKRENNTLMRARPKKSNNPKFMYYTYTINWQILI